MFPRKTTVGVFVAVAASLAVPERAEACSGPSCMYTPNTAPRENGTVPSNAPALVLSTGYYSEFLDAGINATLPPDAGFELLYPDGGVVPSTLEPVLGAWLLRPETPLEAGAGYVLSYNQICPSTTTVDATYRIPFSVSGPAALPTAVASIQVVEQKKEDRGDGGSMCGGAGGILSWSKLEIAPTADMVPWLGLARLQLVVDGQVWSAAPYGRLTWGPAPERMPLVRTIFFLHTTCSGATSDPGVTPGTHNVRLVANIPGMDASFESAEYPVAVDCDAGWLYPQPSHEIDGGNVVPDADGGEGVSGSNYGACAAGGGGAILPVVLVLPALLRRRRATA